MALYDAYGRTLIPRRLNEEQAAPTMAGVRNIYSVDASVGRTDAGTAHGDPTSRPNSATPSFISNWPRRWRRRTSTISPCSITRKQSLAQLDMVGQAGFAGPGRRANGRYGERPPVQRRP